ncbi:hypothetical protein [Streptomyces sp. RerS4]|uniref:hypothetical protein n=1 Tax=Streptomyces sp. RerS4 TaxID=2942449 RepID=UPI00201C7D01|nr:hypothetical protein [Streptomyces sp. RerS4]UQW99478.1 hypothetical protein M4D82_02240 [Streptomyces sp. RerS4]
MGSPHDLADSTPGRQPPQDATTKQDDGKHRGGPGGSRGDGDNGQRSFTVTVPSFDRVAGGAVNAAMLPVAVARQVLPAKKGLPIYLGLGALAAAEVLEWPVAIGIGIGYAVLRREGAVIGAPSPTTPPGAARATGEPKGQPAPGESPTPMASPRTETPAQPAPGSMT